MENEIIVGKKNGTCSKTILHPSSIILQNPIIYQESLHPCLVKLWTITTRLSLSNEVVIHRGEEIWTKWKWNWELGITYEKWKHEGIVLGQLKQSPSNITSLEYNSSKFSHDHIIVYFCFLTSISNPTEKTYNFIPQEEKQMTIWNYIWKQERLNNLWKVVVSGVWSCVYKTKHCSSQTINHILISIPRNHIYVQQSLESIYVSL